MKVKPKLLYSDKFNKEDFDGFHIEYIYPKDDEVRIAQEHKIRQSEMFDDDVEYETFENNKGRQFTKRLTIAEMDELTDEQYIAYHVFLRDFAEQELENKKQDI